MMHERWRYAVAFFVAMTTIFGVVSCGRAERPSETPPSAPTVALPEHPLNKAPGIVRGRVVGADTGVIWTAGIMEFLAEDPEIRMAAAAPVKNDRTFEITLPALAYDVPFAVIAFRDENGNKTLDRGEDFIGGKSIGPGYEGGNLFLFTEGGTFVGDRSWDLTEVLFEIDVSLR